jgi:hypothetical protein
MSIMRDRFRPADHIALADSPPAPVPAALSFSIVVVVSSRYRAGGLPEAGQRSQQAAGRAGKI